MTEFSGLQPRYLQYCICCMPAFSFLLVLSADFSILFLFFLRLCSNSDFCVVYRAWWTILTNSGNSLRSSIPRISWAPWSSSLSGWHNSDLVVFIARFRKNLWWTITWCPILVCRYAEDFSRIVLIALAGFKAGKVYVYHFLSFADILCWFLHSFKFLDVICGLGTRLPERRLFLDVINFLCLGYFCK